MTLREPTDVFLVKGSKGLDDGFLRESNSRTGLMEKALHPCGAQGKVCVLFHKRDNG